MDINRLYKALETGKREEVLKVLKENIPDKLYKFVWLDGSSTDDLKFKSLEEQDLWISKITEFNDPFEFKGYFINAAEFRKYGYPEAIIKQYADCLDFRMSTEYVVSRILPLIIFLCGHITLIHIVAFALNTKL